MNKTKTLTKGEMQVMNVLWSLPDSQGTSHDIMNRMPEPKPATTTLLTFLKILTEKGFVEAVKVGKGKLFRGCESGQGEIVLGKGKPSRLHLFLYA